MAGEKQKRAPGTDAERVRKLFQAKALEESRAARESSGIDPEVLLGTKPAEVEEPTKFLVLQDITAHFPGSGPMRIERNRILTDKYQIQIIRGMGLGNYLRPVG